MPDQAEMRKSHEKQNMETDEESRNCDSAGRSHVRVALNIFLAERNNRTGADSGSRFFAGTGTVYRSECVLERQRIRTGGAWDPDPRLE